MATPALLNFEALNLPGNLTILRPSGYIDNRVLAANVAETVTVPTGANVVLMTATANFYASYILTGDSTNLVTNGAFASDTAWTKGTGWTIAAGKATSDASQSGNSDLSQTPSGLVNARPYLVTFTVSGRSAGTITPVIGTTAGTVRSTNATFAETIIAGSGTDIVLRADLDFDGSVDDFSVVPVATVPAADDAVGSGVELNPQARMVSGVSQISLVSAATCIVSLSYYS